MALNRRKRRKERRDIAVRHPNANYNIDIGLLTGRYRIVRIFAHNADPRTWDIPKSMVPQWIIDGLAMLDLAADAKDNAHIVDFGWKVGPSYKLYRPHIDGDTQIYEYAFRAYNFVSCTKTGRIQSLAANPQNLPKTLQIKTSCRGNWNDLPKITGARADYVIMDDMVDAMRYMSRIYNK